MIALLGEYEEVFLNTEEFSEIMLIFKNSINKGETSPVNGKIKLDWEKIIKSTEKIELDPRLVFELHGYFDREAKVFKLEPKSPYFNFFS